MWKSLGLYLALYSFQTPELLVPNSDVTASPMGRQIGSQTFLLWAAGPPLPALSAGTAGVKWAGDEGGAHLCPREDSMTSLVPTSFL